MKATIKRLKTQILPSASAAPAIDPVIFSPSPNLNDDDDDFFGSTTNLPKLSAETIKHDEQQPEQEKFADNHTNSSNENYSDSDTSGIHFNLDSNSGQPTGLVNSLDGLDEQNSNVDALQRKRKLPKIPSLRTTFKDGMSWFYKLTPAQREHVTVYVYRSYPIIIRNTSEKYIDICIAPFDVKYMEETHGGGKYTFYFLDTALAKNNQLFGSSLEIDINFKAPILDYSELDVTHPKNSKYVAVLKRDGVLTMEGKVREVVTPQANNEAVTMKLIDAVLADRSATSQGKSRTGDDMGAVMAKAMDMVTSTIKSSADANSPDKMLGLMMKFMEMNKPAVIAPTEDKLTPMFAMMLKMQSESHQQMIDILKSQNQQQTSAAEPVDPLDQLEKMINMSEKLGFSRRNPPPVVKDTLDKVLEYGAPVLQSVMGIIQQHLSLNSTAAARPMPSIPNGAGMIDGMTEDAAQQSTNNNNIPEDTDMIQLKLMLVNYGAMILSHMDGIDKTGDMFADALVGMLGMPTYNQIAKVGADKLFAAMKATPQFWVKAEGFGEDYVREFCSTFCRYPEIIKAEQAQYQREEDSDNPFDGDGDESEPKLKVKKSSGVN